MPNSNIDESYSSESALDATDAVISELKNLARSMLEATNLARNKTRTFGRPCLENYLCGLEKYKEVNSLFPEKEEINSLELQQEKIYEHNCNAMKGNFQSFKHGHNASFFTENVKENEFEEHTRKEVCIDEPCLEEEKYTTSSSVYRHTNKVKPLEKSLNNRVCRLPERKYKANFTNVNVNAISNSISIIDVSSTDCITNNRAKTTEAQESTNSLYIDKRNSSSHAINNKESVTKSNNTKEEIICEPQETSNLINSVKNEEDLTTSKKNLSWQKEVNLEETKRNAKWNETCVSIYTNIPANEHLMYEQAKMVKWFGSISDGVCTFTFCDKSKKINDANVHTERENYRAEWYNNILNSLWNAEPHTRFVDVKQISVTKNISQIYANTDEKQTELKEIENKADENDVNFCANAWSANWCEDDDANYFNTRRKAKCIATKVFRVPTFPFGGGITWAQLEYLQDKFNKVLQNEGNKSQSNECINNPINEQECNDKICIEQNCTRSMAQKFPRLITLKAFSHRSSSDANKDTCNDVTTTSTTIANNESDGYYSLNNHDNKNHISDNYDNNDATNFNLLERFDPISPYEFVAELERKIIFDAVSARRERLEMFRREVEEKKFPAIPDTFDLRIIMDPLRTGFQEDKTFPIIKGDIIADRYEVVELLGKATFSRTVRCYDLHKPIYAEEDESMEYDDDDDYSSDDQNENEDGSKISLKESPEREYCQLLESQRQPSSITSNVHVNTMDETDKESRGEQKQQRIFSNNEKSVAYAEKLVHQAHKKCKERKVLEPISYVEVCLKIINNSKDFFDQSLDEIRLLRFINAHKDADEAHVIRLFDAFYYKEHTMLVTELLSDNLYEYSKYNRENESEPYFTLEHLRSITRQIIESLAYIHSLKLIHADLKPENILFVSHRQCIVKIIDFGSSCFLSDHLSSYIQSRSYRAPEVILGCDYDGRIDVWSLGAILVELVTGEVLFPSKTVPDMLARIVHVCGSPLPRSMLWEGRHTCSYFNKFGCIYEIDNSNRSLMQKEDEDAVFKGTKFEQVDTNVIINRKGMESIKPPTIYLYTPVHEVNKKFETEQKLQHAKCRSIGQSETKEQNRRVETAFEMPSLVVNKSHSVLRQKLAAAGMKDELFISFVETCLHLDHKERSTSNELLTHPFISHHYEFEEEHTTSLLFVPELKNELKIHEYVKM